MQSNAFADDIDLRNVWPPHNRGVGKDGSYHHIKKPPYGADSTKESSAPSTNRVQSGWRLIDSQLLKKLIERPGCI